MDIVESTESIVVSIITPLHNAESYLRQTLESIFSQTFQGWELILIDDNSTDNTIEIAHTYLERDHRVRLIQLDQNSGAAVARNKGIEQAKGRYLAFLDSDDLWLPDKLEKQLHFMQETACPFTYTAYEKIDKQGEYLGKVGVPALATYKSLLKTCFIGCLTVMLDTEYFGRVAMPLLRKRQDYGLWLKLLKQTDEAKGMPEVLARYRVHQGSISANKLNAVVYTWRLYRNVERLSLIQSLYYFSHYAVKGLLRHRMPKLARAVGVLH